MAANHGCVHLPFGAPLNVRATELASSTDCTIVCIADFFQLPNCHLLRAKKKAVSEFAAKMQRLSQGAVARIFNNSTNEEATLQVMLRFGVLCAELLRI